MWCRRVDRPASVRKCIAYGGKILWVKTRRTEYNQGTPWCKPQKAWVCAQYHPGNSGIEQWPARKAHNLEVVGSNPTPATKAVSTKPVVEWLKPLSRQCRCSVTESQCLLLSKHNTNIVR